MSIEDNDFSAIKKELKDLPQIRVPADFDVKLYKKITRIKLKKSSGIIDNIFFPIEESRPRVLVYSAFSVIICCCVFLVYLFLRNYKGTTINESTSIDSTYYQGKKVIILPPTSPVESDQMGQAPVNKLIESPNTENYDKNNIYKYLTPPDSLNNAEKQSVNANPPKDTISKRNNPETKGGPKPDTLLKSRKNSRIILNQNK